MWEINTKTNEYQSNRKIINVTSFNHVDKIKLKQINWGRTKVGNSVTTQIILSIILKVKWYHIVGTPSTNKIRKSKYKYSGMNISLP